MTTLKILLCEASQQHREELPTAFKNALDLAGVNGDVRVSSSIDQAVSLIETENFDVLITDLTFNQHVHVGLTFISKIKQDYPELFIVACSTNSPPVNVYGVGTTSFDLFITKLLVLNGKDEDLEKIGFQIANNINKLNGFELRLKNKSFDELTVTGEPLPKRDLQALVAQVLRDLANTAPDFRPKTVTLEPITGGYSGSLVMLLTLNAEEPNLKFVQTIIKISLVDWARDESANFRRYAKWMLPFNKRVELVGEGKTKKFGAVAYAFVFGGETQFQSLTTIIEASDDIKFMRFAETIFDADAINFYNSTKLRSSTTGGQHYLSRYFSEQSKLDDAYEQLKTVLLTNFQARVEGNQFIIGEESYENPLRVIFSGAPSKFQLSVCHGDFNSNNIFCSEDGRVAYIDFQDTGPGHILQDAVALEHSVRLNWREPNLRQSANRAQRILKIERGIFEAKPRKTKKVEYDKVCVELRSLISDKFTNVEAWEYPFSVCTIALKLLRLPSLNDMQKCRLAACALVSSKELARLQ